MCCVVLYDMPSFLFGSFFFHLLLLRLLPPVCKLYFLHTYGFAHPTALTMNHSPPRKIHRWHLAIAKLHLKREHRCPSSKASDDLHKVASEVGDGPMEDQKDGFYRYSESLVEEEEKSLALALQKTRSSHQTQTSSSDGYVVSPYTLFLSPLSFPDY